MLKHLTFIENHPVFNPILQVVLEYLGKTLGDPEKMYTYAAWTKYTFFPGHPLFKAYWRAKTCDTN